MAFMLKAFPCIGSFAVIQILKINCGLIWPDTKFSTRPRYCSFFWCVCVCV
uniref:Uncharacterized protein n=1 Tax=Rhizophora mucronata TaxID=61149 RepID=A0A2P2PDA8_RHIMU